MSPEYLAPGVYVDEIPASVHTIEGVSTSTAAFVGRAASGPADKPVLVTSLIEFEEVYGGLAVDCPLGFAVRDFFINGGMRAWIARVVHRDINRNEDESVPITDDDVADPSLIAEQSGLWLLDQADSINVLCIPPLSRTTDVARTTWNAAIEYAKQRFAFVIVDPPAAWTSADDALVGLDQLVTRDANAAVYFPRIVAPDPLNSNLPDTFAPCGAVAGIYARTDATRGVWKSPAGTAAALLGTTGLATSLDDSLSQTLNTEAINILRSFPTYGNVVWGARTLLGADTSTSEWKYVPVRRLALYIEESIDRGLRWVIFEPNDERLWARIRNDIGVFLQNLFGQGAFQGNTPQQAYFVKCDAETTSQDDLAQGLVNILIGFAPMKPAEFVILSFQQRAGQT